MKQKQILRFLQNVRFPFCCLVFGAYLAPRKQVRGGPGGTSPTEGGNPYETTIFRFLQNVCFPFIALYLEHIWPLGRSSGEAVGGLAQPRGGEQILMNPYKFIRTRITLHIIINPYKS